MTPLYLISPYWYADIFLWTATVLGLAAAWVCCGKNNVRLLRGSPNSAGNAWSLASVLTLFLGTRPSSGAFGDMGIYRKDFFEKYFYGTDDSVSRASEPLWEGLQNLAHHVAPSTSVYDQFILFSFLVCAVYILFMCWACVRLNRRCAYLLLLFQVANFQFYVYCVNGMRNGMACSMVLLALTYMTPHTADKVKAAALCICAYLIHNSVIVPVAAIFGSYFFLRDTRKCIYVWLGAIALSFVAGHMVEDLLIGFGFDSRVEGYLTNHDAQILSEFGAGVEVKYGFRWDFLLYSFAPIWLGWYVVCRRRITDQWYTLLLNSYILANSVWVLAIRALSSNRFAYLSWFMYGLVVAYPLFRFRIYRHQGVVAAAFLVGSMIFMWLF